MLAKVYKNKLSKLFLLLNFICVRYQTVFAKWKAIWTPGSGSAHFLMCPGIKCLGFEGLL